MRKFDFIDFLLWNSDEQDFYSYQKFNINLDWIQNNYEVEIVFETNFNEIFYQLLVEQERINKIKDKVTWHWISQIRLYNEFGPIAVQKKGQSKIYLYSFKVSPIQSILLNGKETTIWKEKNRDNSFSLLE